MSLYEPRMFSEKLLRTVRSPHLEVMLFVQHNTGAGAQRNRRISQRPFNDHCSGALQTQHGLVEGLPLAAEGASDDERPLARLSRWLGLCATCAVVICSLVLNI